MNKLIDNSPMGLVDALVARIAQTLGASWWHENGYGDMHSPHVHAQFLPGRANADAERDVSQDRPIVQVFHGSGKMESLKASTLKIVILFGGWSDARARQGWRIPTAMMWAVLQDLLSDTYIGAYEFIAPVEWMIPEDDEPPHWGATLTTTWRVRRIAQDVSGDLANMFFNHEEMRCK